MKKLISDYDYSRQFILVEKKGKKIYESLPIEKSTKKTSSVPYQWKVITTVSKKIVGGVEYNLIQFDNERLGWINLEDSLQIFRFSNRYCRIDDGHLSNNEINRKMNNQHNVLLEKTNKLLTIKSAVFFEEEQYFSVFHNEEFLGFYEAGMLDELVKCDIAINLDEINQNIKFYNNINLDRLEMIEKEIHSITLKTVFEKLAIGEVVINDSDSYWVDLTTLGDIEEELSYYRMNDMDFDRYLVEDLLYSMNLERLRSKEIVKTALSLKNKVNESINEERESISKNLLNASIKDKKKIEKLNDEVKELKNVKLDMGRSLRKVKKELDLSYKRLEHQKDYTTRLEAQRDKYKNRMTEVEEKLKNLNEKYRNLRNEKKAAKR